MMEWALAILFGVAVLLLILSFIKTRQSSSKIEQEMDQLSFTFMEEVYQLQQQIRNIEIEAEITIQEAGLLASSSEHRLMLREVLDLYKRGYSIENIAAKKRMAKNELENLIAPYSKTKIERSKVANDI
ncbi:hypothetical protein [Bacillus sp. FSL K6-3431]|uniref:hypothetical protein n=1 Tax=Bacillus sp. FSL K6-3431 TaxID=2921500 RepID=UPI0030F99989